MRPEVTPRRTGLVVFGSRIISAFTGLIFVVMMVRSLSVAQFGLWEVITSIVVFAAYPAGLLTYWATREVARGKVVGKTTISLNLLASLVGVGIFLVFALLSYSFIGGSLAPFILSLILLPLTYWNQATTALVAGYNPSIGGYSLLVSEPAKLLVAYPLLFVFHLKIYGVIIAIAVSYLVQAAACTYQLRAVTTDNVDLSTGRRWLKDYHVPAIVTLAYAIGVADTFAASLGQGGTGLAGFYQAPFQVATIIFYAIYLSSALYPLLLRDRSNTPPDQLLKVTLEFTLLFAIPMAAGAIALAPQILYLLSPVYAMDGSALMVLAVSQSVAVVLFVLNQALTGSERADLAAENRTRAILRSNLMFVPVLSGSFLAAYVASVFVIGRVSAASSLPLYQFATYWALTQLAFYILMVAVVARRLNRTVKISVPRSVFRFVAAGAAMAILVNLVGGAILATGLGTLEYGLRLASIVLLGVAAYFGLLLLIDGRVRGYFRTILGMLGR